LHKTLRIDDIGASTKQFEVYSKRRFGNFLFLKYLPWFKAWGPYQEMSADEWQQVLDLLTKCPAKLTVGVTASWVEKDGEKVDVILDIRKGMSTYGKFISVVLFCRQCEAGVCS
jgi:hypothetical protein